MSRLFGHGLGALLYAEPEGYCLVTGRNWIDPCFDGQGYRDGMRSDIAGPEIGIERTLSAGQDDNAEMV